MAKRKIERTEVEATAPDNQGQIEVTRVELPPQNQARPAKVLPKEESRIVNIKCPSAAGIRRVGAYLLVQAGRECHKISVTPADKVTCELKILRVPVANKMITKLEETK